MDKYRYLYIITPIADDLHSSQSEWTGGISVLKRHIKNSSDAVEEQLGKLNAKTETLINSRISEVKSEVKASMAKVND